MIVLAADEVRELGHEQLGPEHELLGLLRGGNEIVLGALAPLTHDDVVAHLDRGEHTSGGQIPFTPAAKRAVELAADAADALDHGLIGTEHLLLGLVAVDDAANALLRECGVAPEDVRASVLEAIG